MKTGPTINKGKSKQDYATPPDFFEAVVRKFGEPAWDLAASAQNTKAPYFYDEAQDSLSQEWGAMEVLCWLNPPFSNIGPWAKKCCEDTRFGGPNRTQILFLVPASVGSNWFRDYVFRKAKVYFLNGRICFDGKDPFPKDCLLAHYGVTPGEEIWTWK